MKHNKAPFKAGQLVETKSFIPGYRGAWFRSKVIEISWKKGSLWCKLEYIDFPDEKLKWTKLYQKPPNSRGGMKDVRREMMVRPRYPHIYQEHKISDSRNIFEAAVIVGNNWMVGDLVDWWADDVYWCGEVIQLLEGDKARFKLPDPPIGEGETYDVQFKDLRPTLCWSPEQGWAVPINQVVGNRRRCGRLIQPTIRAEQTTLQEQNDAQISTYEFNVSPSSLAPLSSLPSTKMSECRPANLLQHQKLNEFDSMEASHGEHAPLSLPHMPEHHPTNCLLKQKPNKGDSMEACCGEPNQLEDVPSPIFRVTSDNVFKAGDGKKIEDGETRKRMKVSEVDCNLESSDTVEASVMELEELACKVRWLRMLLDHGSQMVNTQPSWKFVENLVTAAPNVGHIPEEDSFELLIPREIMEAAPFNTTHGLLLLQVQGNTSSSMALFIVAYGVLFFLWITNQGFGWCPPVYRSVYPERLPREQELPGLDVPISLQILIRNPTLDVMNTAISAMALDYPTTKLRVYLSDDAGSPTTLQL